MSLFNELIVWLCVGLPNWFVSEIDVFNTTINCSNQFGLFGSFQRTSTLLKLLPAESVTGSDVFIAVSFTRPRAVELRAGL